MKAWPQSSKKSILIGLLSFVLLFNPGTASVKSATAPVKNPWQTEARHRIRPESAHHYLKFLASNHIEGFQACYSFTACIDTHSRLASQVIKTSYRPMADDLLNAHHTYLKIAPGTDQRALFKA